MAYSIELVSDDNAHRWEEFNDQSRGGTCFHSLRWKRVLEDALHLKLRYYLILDDREVVGISPWVEKSILNFRGLVAIPQSEVNSIVLDEAFNPDRFNDVLSLFAKECSFLHFTTYNPALIDRIRFAHVPQGDTGDMVLDLRQKPPDTLWTGFSKNMRRNIRTFERDGFEVQVIDRADDLDTFYRYYVRNLMHIGGEILPLAFFERLRDLFSPEELNIIAVTRDDVFAGGSIAFGDPARKTAYLEYLAINRDLSNRYTPTYCIMWEGINWAWKNGYERVSFGQQRPDPENPRFQYKVKFGAEHIPVSSRMVLFSKPIQMMYRVKKMLPESRKQNHGYRPHADGGSGRAVQNT